mmetsp:Transcript_52998/g.113742  ORF Transcript_52998/g.113742 Transcript_52998/m.113742 type:complete len:246 (-) Transcript_52998:464-1201(-)
MLVLDKTLLAHAYAALRFRTVVGLSIALLLYPRLHLAGGRLHGRISEARCFCPQSFAAPLSIPGHLRVHPWRARLHARRIKLRLLEALMAHGHTALLMAAVLAHRRTLARHPGCLARRLLAQRFTLPVTAVRVRVVGTWRTAPFASGISIVLRKARHADLAATLGFTTACPSRRTLRRAARSAAAQTCAVPRRLVHISGVGAHCAGLFALGPERVLDVTLHARPTAALRVGAVLAFPGTSKRLRG